MLFNVLWSSTLIDFYKYGSRIEFAADSVYFENEILSPGAIIVSWNSNLSYQSTRNTNKLPLLEKGKKYTLLFKGEVSPKSSSMLKLTFYDRGGQVIAKKVLSGQGGDFTYLKETYAYSIAIISVGLKQMSFKKLLIYSKEEGE